MREIHLSPYVGGAVEGAVGALAPPKAPLRRVGGGLRCPLENALYAHLSLKYVYLIKEYYICARGQRMAPCIMFPGSASFLFFEKYNLLL